MLEYITTLLSRLFGGVLLGWDQVLLNCVSMFTECFAILLQRKGGGGSAAWGGLCLKFYKSAANLVQLFSWVLRYGAK